MSSSIRSANKWVSLLMLAVLWTTLGRMERDPYDQSQSSQDVLQRQQQAATLNQHSVRSDYYSKILLANSNLAKSHPPEVNTVKMSNASYQQTIKPIKPVSQMTHEELMQHYRAVEVIATGYSAGVESTGKDPDHPSYGITYSGVKVKRDKETISTIAADLSVFPLGTVLWIPGYGYGIVADIGSAIKGHKIDLYFQSKDAVYKEWGKKQLQVYIIEEGEGKLTEEMFRQKNETYRII
ncbi:3D domain-containing protein [Marinicrinis lubricantis]|uniref:3D domain-containing protein n=1 Tax=Marinicrinis lubricantis TaxID=2086470 RepID=A0ABW1ILL1_9BACL